MPRVSPFSAALKVVGTSSCFSSKGPRARRRKQTEISSSLGTPRCHSRALPGGPQQSPTVSQETAPSLPGRPHNLCSIGRSLIGKYPPLPAHIQRPPSKQPADPSPCSVQLIVTSTPEVSPGFCTFSYRIKYIQVLSVDGAIPARNPRKPLATSLSSVNTLLHPGV